MDVVTNIEMANKINLWDKPTISDFGESLGYVLADWWFGESDRRARDPCIFNKTIHTYVKICVSHAGTDIIEYST